MKSKRREALFHRSREETTILRAAVFKRANGACETCGRFIDEESGHWDHRLGRGKEPQSVFNTWALCVACDVAVTTSDPSAAWWWRRFLVHLRECGEKCTTTEEIAEYLLVATKAGKKLDLLLVKGMNT